jgi:hypothetical protein
VALLLAPFGSVVPGGGVTVAVLIRSPLAVGLAVPVTVKTTELPVPAGILTVEARLLPEPVAPLVTAAPPVVDEVQVTPVRIAGIESATVTPTASLGPLLG